MPAGQGRDDGHGRADGHGRDEESFATAVEFGYPPEFGGGELSRDLAIVALLRAGRDTYAPTAEERGRSRAAVLARLAAATDPSDRLPVPAPSEGLAPDGARPVPEATAVLPRVDDEPDHEPADELAAVRRKRRSGRHSMPVDPRARRRSPLGLRIVLTAAAAVLGTAVLGGAGVLASQDALPGDGLYSVKRVAESASLAMTWDDTARAHRHLELASTRIDEVEQLLARNPDVPVDPAVYSAALRDFDTEADEGSRLLLASSDAPRAQTMAHLQSWASDQADRLAALRGSLPGPAASDARGSLRRLEQLVDHGAVDTEPCPDASGACIPDVDDPAGAAPDEVGAGETNPTDSTEDGPASGGASPSGQGGGRTTGTQQPGGDQPGLLPELLPEPVGGVLGDDQSSPTTSTPADPSDDDSEDESSGKESGENGSSGGALDVPPLIPGVPGVSLG